MQNTLMIYLNKRLEEQNSLHRSMNSEPGPVICISREVGCSGVNIAKMLAAELDKHSHGTQWRVLSKEILEQSAQELNMEPAKLNSLMKDGDRGWFDDVLNAFSEKRHKSDRKISKTIVDLIASFANDGHCIIVGRAGHIIARNIERSLLVKLIAPFGWRVKQIMQKNQLNAREAIDFIEKTEKERQNFRKHISGENAFADEFDLTINLDRLNSEQAISIIHAASQAKGLLEIQRHKAAVM